VKITAIDSRDAYADAVGFADGFPVGSDGEKVWPLHCYGMLGVGRGMSADSGNGASLYIVSGHAPRHLDKNLTVPGRVLTGIELLTALPRGTGPLGFFASPEEYFQILNVRMGDELAEEDRANIEVLRTDTASFEAYVASRTTRNEEFFIDPTGRIEICNINPPVRKVD
jgi:peptidylprolyl isomerase